MILLPLLVPAMLAPLPPGTFDFQRFKDTRLVPGSDPALLAALDRLWRDSPTFRTHLKEFALAEPRIWFSLARSRHRTLGDVVFDVIPKGYHASILVQTTLDDMKADAIDPWVATALYNLFEASKHGGVAGRRPNEYFQSREWTSRAWKFQRQIRSELRRSPDPTARAIPKDVRALYDWHVPKHATGAAVGIPGAQQPSGTDR